jgi:hypothetical protein
MSLKRENDPGTRYKAKARSRASKGRLAGSANLKLTARLSCSRSQKRMQRVKAMMSWLRDDARFRIIPDWSPHQQESSADGSLM